MSLKKVGKDKQTGRRIQIYRSGFRTKGEVAKAMNQILAEIDSGDYFEPSNIPLKEYLHNWLWDTYQYKVLVTSFEVAETVSQVHLIPYFNQTPLSSITTFGIDQFYVFKLREGLSNATVRKIHNVLSKALQRAVQWELIKVNPAKHASPPTVHKTIKSIWTVDEAKAFLEVCQKHNDTIPFLLALFTGMRRGEILALKW
ncbi:Arm DNA-binding domain-containing protein [Paracerasibacillus soli]|uniref:Arm DNA-binding domain-containing protein n=1 Tax=Paracerasibacillus soli TaxID=480284 RepID=A0ABU5CUT6_9BACI|nr:Arm DNA-binding domain-containing protein [Virgibacillus soli]MDY0410137.1 Arm DNA-binding domain-containing protein [Virgibacillus soli]